MNNKMIKLLAVVGGLLLMSPLAFAGSEPAPPSSNLVNGKPVINRVMLTLSPSSLCGGTGVDCAFGDLMIVGRCKGVIISAMLQDQDLTAIGLDAPSEDITDIVEEGIEGRFFEGLGDQLALQNPTLDQNKCPVSGRDYQVQKVQKFENDEGVISAVIRLVPKE